MGRLCHIPVLPTQSGGSGSGTINVTGQGALYFDNTQTVSNETINFGNAAYFGHIQRANPGIDPSRIKAGDSIILPDKNEVIAAAPATAKQPSAADLVVDQTRQYRVQAGDNLSMISKKLYGRYDKWVQIYELNKELIGQNPAALKKDMILALPEPPIRPAGTIQ